MVRRTKKIEKDSTPKIVRRGRPKKVTQPEINSTETETPERIVLKHVSREEVLLENKRKLIMWVGVGVVMIFIVFTWFLNLQTIVGKDTTEVGKVIKFEDFKNKIAENFKQVSSGIATLKKEVASTSMETNQEATSTEDGTYNTNIEEVNRELNKLISNASSTINNN